MQWPKDESKHGHIPGSNTHCIARDGDGLRDDTGEAMQVR